MAALVWAAAGLAALGCAAWQRPALEPVAAVASVYTAPDPSDEERYCAWYGDAAGGVLYFGLAAFWSAQGEARGAAPEADLERPGPVLVGRFDLARERFLAPLEVGAPGDRSGVWDVLARPGERLFFTRFFEPSGVIDLATGRARSLPELGTGLNELAPGPAGGVLVSRYGGPAPRGVLVLEADGRPATEHLLDPPVGYEAAPKTVAFDPARAEIWVTTDLLPKAGGAIRHDGYVLDADGRELRRIERPELQFVAFGPDGAGYRAEVEDGELWLVARAGGGVAPRRILLDRAFPADLDFVQDIQIAADGRAAVARWSGRVHVVDRAGRVRSLALPALEPDGLYYTAVLHGDRVCATYCAGVTVVCAPVF